MNYDELLKDQDTQKSILLFLEEMANVEVLTCCLKVTDEKIRMLENIEELCWQRQCLERKFNKNSLPK